MISLKTINTSFTPIHGVFPGRETLRKRRSVLSLCKSNNSDEEKPSQPQGNTLNQELLARIAILQTQKLRLKNQTKSSEENIVKDFREKIKETIEILKNLKSEMQDLVDEIEEEKKKKKLESEEKEKKVSDSEDNIGNE